MATGTWSSEKGGHYVRVAVAVEPKRKPRKKAKTNLKPKPPRKRVRTASRPHPTGQTPVQEAFAYIAANAKALPLAKTRGEALNIIQNWLAMTSTNRDDT